MHGDLCPKAKIKYGRYKIVHKNYESNDFMSKE